MALTQISTAGVKDDAVTSGKIPANAVGSSELADNAVDTNAIVNVAVTSGKIADSAITNSKVSSSAAISGTKLADNSIPLAKLPNGDSNNNGKFLRANNGADPSFETITGTTINNNADNRVITGTGTANTIQGESGLLFDGQEVQITNAQPKLKLIDTGVSNVEARVDGDGGNLIIAADHNNAVADTTMTFTIDQSEKLRIDSSGRLLVNTTSGHGKLQVHDGSIVHSKPAGGGTRNWKFVNNNTAVGDYGIQISTTEEGSTYANHTELKAGGDVHIHDGNLVVASGHGISFAADGNESGATGELLDDYETGTYTAHFAIEGQSNMSMSGRIGLYTRVGNVVTVIGGGQCASTTGAGTGNAIEFSNLPFPVFNTSGTYGHPFPVKLFNMDSSGLDSMSGSRPYIFKGRLFNDGSHGRIEGERSDSAQNAVNSSLCLSTNTEILYMFTYITDA